MKKIEVLRVMETSYENGSYWIEYSVNGLMGYEIVYNIQDIELIKSPKEIIKRVDNARIYYQRLFNTDAELNKKLTSKCKLSTFDSELKHYIEECLESENEMWYITEEDLEEMFGNNEDVKNNYITKIQEEAQKLGLEEYIEVNKNDDDVIIIYGGIITHFLFGEENVDSDIESNNVVYVVSQSYRFVHDALEIDDSILLVTKNYQEAKEKLNQQKKSWKEDCILKEDCIFTEEYKDMNIVAYAYDEEGDGVTIALEAWNI